ncbi:hypothetical protein [Alicyclobacillus mengziensis]|uniref:Transposase IS4-like domain-containing protein n=1 Tax=Alicyclobacillus mengziensis TaxID=2931921 RepID=A0A9X7Z7R2_9BACL|nr:hypothetical protein [Alicyclobacillus mengziensis]QSO47493.1 hypothetical protein JZ786_24450 [Alicyclobacillus mengziensis]
MKQEDNSATGEPKRVRTDDVAAEHKAAYLLLSNRHDASSEVMGAWLKRWRIEVLFHTVKQRT